MTTVRFINPSSSIEVDAGTTILQAARKSGAPVGSTCGGACACSSCHVFIEEGAELLSEMDDDEETILSIVFGTTDQSRLACQANVEGEGVLVVKLSPETRKAYEEGHARAG